MEPRRRDKDADGLSVSGSGSGRAIVIGPYLRRQPVRQSAPRAAQNERPPEARLEEAVGLARAIDLEVVQSGIVPIGQIRPATYMGSGKVDEIAGLVKSLEAGIVIADCALSPVQQRNLEKAWGAKVLDRTGLILEIFGRRAHTKEGALQVEHAKVKNRRKLHRDSRARVPYPIVALVGYTNAGKSTLFNRMTRASVLQADMLFATLDPTLRAVQLPGGMKIILSDTVGFISDLPTMLVAAFRATLEEVIEADVILHVRDVSHEDTEAQSHDVEEVLGALGIDADKEQRLIEVWNKIDRLDADGRSRLKNLAERRPLGQRPVLVSALSGQGIEELILAIETRLGHRRVVLDLVVDPADGAGMSWLHRHTEVMEKTLGEDGRMAMTVRVDPTRTEAVKAKFSLHQDANR